MDTIRLGFVGVGSMGQCAHLQNYISVDGCMVAALAELRQDLGRRVAERYGVPRVYKDHQGLLANEKLDGIVAIGPYSRHGVLLPELFAAGVGVMTEKPLAWSVQVGQKIVDALAQTSASYFVGYHKRSDPATIYAKENILKLKQSGELGKLRYVRIIMPPGDWIAQGFGPLISSQESTGTLESDPQPPDMDQETFKAYNLFVNYYIHQVNLLRHLLDEDYRVSYADPSGVVLVGHSDSGVAVTLEMAPYETTIDWQEQALICFEKGFVQLDLPAPLTHNRPGKVTIFRDPGDGATPVTVVPQLPWVHAMRQQAIHFVSALRGEATPLCPATDALKDLVLARDYIRMIRSNGHERQ